MLYTMYTKKDSVESSKYYASAVAIKSDICFGAVSLQGSSGS